MLLFGSSCANLKIEKETRTSGTFRSTAASFTFLGIDFPAPALSIARGNAADSGRPGLIVEKETVIPYLGPLDWLFEIISVRYARVSGRWGDPAD